MGQPSVSATPAFQWSDAYVLGVPGIDVQHRGFLEMTNAFLDVASSGRADHEALQAALDELVAYGQNHFQTEEEFMERVGFPEEEKQRHAGLHNDFVFRVSELAQRFRKGDASLAREIVAFLCDWVIQHIMQVDVKYAQFHQTTAAAQTHATLIPGATVNPPRAPLASDSLPNMLPDSAPLPSVAPAGSSARPAATASDRIAGAPEFLGPYRILDQLGRGGMGAVYRAVHNTLERPAAIKLLPAEMAASPEHVMRFLREARAVSALRHPNVVMVYDAGEAEGRYYIAMELIEGESLAAHLEDRDAMEEEEALELLSQCLKGLSAAHAEGLVHRDIKPENLLLDKKRSIHIADFGLVMETASTTCLTVSGAMMGTPQYISPEQADGSKADQRSDLYSLGVTFYRAMTGQLPFQAPTAMSLLFKHKYERPVPPNEVRPELSDSTNRLILWLMGKRRKDRPPSAERVLEMIEAIRSGTPVPEPPVPELPVIPETNG